MTNTAQDVRDYLNKHPHVRKSLHEGILNTRALATFLYKKIDSKGSLHGIITAIRRYEAENREKTVEVDKISQIYKNSRISTKSRLVIIEVRRHFKVLKVIIPKILERIHVSRGEVLRIIEARESIDFVIDHSKKDEIAALVPPDELVGVTENAGEINIHFSEEYGDCPGLIGPVLNELAIHNINIIEIVGSMPELSIIFNEDEISKAHDLLLRLFYRN